LPKLIAGVINGFAISFVNFIYQRLASWFVYLENHKHADTYEISLIYKLFIFKFINTNISLFWTGFVTRDFEALYLLLIGMVIQKSATMLFFKTAFKWAFYWWAKRGYFKKVEQLAST